MLINELYSLLPTGFADDARVWIYQSNRPFFEKEVTEINEQLYQFYAQWQSHGAPVKGWAGLLYNRFIVIMADETNVPVGGCSTDSSVRLIKSIERQYSIQLFDRLTLTFLVNDKPEMLPYHQVQYALDKRFINKDTLLFNNTILTKQELLNQWLIPISESWLSSRVNFGVVVE